MERGIEGRKEEKGERVRNRRPMNTVTKSALENCINMP